MKRILGLDPVDIEVELLLEAIYRRWGNDFRDYSLSASKRRICRFVEVEKLSSISELQGKVLRDPLYLERLLQELTINVTSMFRDPTSYLAFRKVVVPLLKAETSIRIWCAGCATGEEVYSLAILLFEEGLLERTQIYATDLDQVNLDIGKAGHYSQEKIEQYSQDYLTAGGVSELSNYYETDNGCASMRRDLSKNIVWAQHNLVTDASFNEFQVIFCRNVLIYFNPSLQVRVHSLLMESLTQGGVLILGRQETLRLTTYETKYRALSHREKIYQLKS